MTGRWAVLLRFSFPWACVGLVPCKLAPMSKRSAARSRPKAFNDVPFPNGQAGRLREQKIIFPRQGHGLSDAHPHDGSADPRQCLPCLQRFGISHVQFGPWCSFFQDKLVKIITLLHVRKVVYKASEELFSILRHRTSWRLETVKLSIITSITCNLFILILLELMQTL